MNSITPPHSEPHCIGKKKVRNSNLELYRIIVMLLIIAHHYVVNSGLIQVLGEEPLNISSTIMLLFGAWGKTGINCFVLITGYFMCKSRFTWEKLLKLYLQIFIYGFIIYLLFCITGHEKFSVIKLLWTIWPVKSISSGFISCFILFYLFIPFLNIFLQSLDKKKHAYLLILAILAFSVLPTVPLIRMSFNYVGWFIVLYFVGAYIRTYGLTPRISHRMWGWLSIFFVLIGSFTVVGMTALYKANYISIHYPYYFISDSNKMLSLMIGVSSFMYFKDIKIPHSRLINVLGGATFGVLLIHANSDTMRRWLWQEVVDCTGNYVDDVFFTLGYAILTVLLIFIVCAGIDWFRGKFIEPHLMKAATSFLNFCRRKFDDNKLPD